MRTRIGALLTVAVLLAAPALAAARQELTRAIDATVFIKVDRFFRNQSVPTFGSGFFIDARGHVLTNWHVVAPQIQLVLEGRDTEVATTLGAVRVVVNSGRADEVTLVARILRLDRARDLALLDVPFAPKAWLDVSAPPEVGLTDAVVAVGYPFGDLLALNRKNPEVTVTRGHTTSIRHGERGDVEAFQLDAAVNPGNSGGPVLNEQGAVVGVAWEGVTNSTGTALAIAPGRLRAFSDDVQFEVNVTPPAIYERRQPLLVEVRPLLRGVEGLSGQVVLSGADIEAARQELTAREGSLTCHVEVPPPAKAAGAPSSYSLTLRLADARGREAFRHSWPVPLREGQAGNVASERAAADVLRDRQDFPNQASSGDERFAAPRKTKDVPLPGNEPDTQGPPPLSQVASGIKLRGSSDSKGIVVTNQNLRSVGFVADEARYAALPSELRAMAIAFDKAEFDLRGLTAGVTYGSGAFSEYETSDSTGGVNASTVGRARSAANASRDQGSDAAARRAEAERARVADENYRGGLARDAGAARATLDAARLKVTAAKLCRCPDHSWFRLADHASCERCATP